MSPGASDWAARCTETCAGGAVGLVHQWATHHVTVDTSLGRIYGRDDWVAALSEERAGLSSDSILRAESWLGVSEPGRALVLELDWRVVHAGPSPLFGPATDRGAVLSSTLVGLLEGERVYRIWRSVDLAAAAGSLGVDLDDRVRTLADSAPPRGGIPWEFGEVHAGLAQTAPPSSVASPPGLSAHGAEPCLRLQVAWNQRRPDLVAPLYSPAAMILNGTETIDHGSPRHPWARILAACPQAVLFYEHAATASGGEETTVAVVWRWVGTHSGEALGPPCQRRLHAKGISTFRLREGRIASERVVFDELGLRKDARLRRTDYQAHS